MSMIQPQMCVENYWVGYKLVNLSRTTSGVLSSLAHLNT